MRSELLRLLDAVPRLGGARETERGLGREARARLGEDARDPVAVAEALALALEANEERVPLDLVSLGDRDRLDPVVRRSGDLDHLAHGLDAAARRDGGALRRRCGRGAAPGTSALEKG